MGESTTLSELTNALVFCHHGTNNSIDVLGSTGPMLRCFAKGPPDRPLNQMFHLPRLLVDLGKHETLKVRVCPIYFDGSVHASRQLVAVAKKLMTRVSVMLAWRATVYERKNGEKGDLSRGMTHTTGLYSVILARHSMMPLT